MTALNPHAAVVAFATSKGPRRAVNADAVAVRRRPNGVVAVAVVDGSGSNPVIARDAELAAEAAVRVGAVHGVLPGVLAAAEMLAEPDHEFPEPDGVMVLAVALPGQPVAIAHVGDCRAYGLTTDGELRQQLTRDHTKGQRLRAQGESEEEAAGFDHVVNTSIARATVGTVGITETFHRTTYLMSDGIRLTNDEFISIVRKHADDPQSCADALVAAAREVGSHDDATVAVIHHPAGILRTGATRTGR